MSEVLEYLKKQALNQEIRDFRSARIALIRENEFAGKELDEGPKIVLHVIPEASFQTRSIIDITKFNNGELISNLAYFSYYTNRRYNSDGFCVYASGRGGDKISTYAQFFRNAIIEAVYLPSLNQETKEIGGWRIIENQIRETFLNHGKVLSRFGIPKPWVVTIALMGAKGFKTSNGSFPTEMVDKELIFAPEMRWEGDDESLDRKIKPLFDSFANAFGVAHSYSFDEEGDFISIK